MWSELGVVLLIVAGALFALQGIIEQSVFRAIMRWESIRLGGTGIGTPEDIHETIAKLRNKATVQRP